MTISQLSFLIEKKYVWIDRLTLEWRCQTSPNYECTNSNIETWNGIDKNFRVKFKHSFFLQCQNVKLDQLLRKMHSDGLLDTLNYPQDDELYSRSYENKIELFKDESKRRRYKEWVFLRPKCYSLKFGDDDENSEKLKAKGIILQDTNLTHSSYLDVYLNNTIVFVDQTKIVSKKHQIVYRKIYKESLAMS